LTDSTGSSGSYYQAEQTVIASYAMTELRLFKQLKLSGGARFENTYLEAAGNGGADTILFPSTSGIIKQLDLLPAVAATFELAKDINLPIGHMHWFITNCHIYPRHYDMLK
jgi:hypothetical protein